MDIKEKYHHTIKSFVQWHFYHFRIERKTSFNSSQLCSWEEGTQEVEIINYDITIKPFDGWDATRAKQSLPWWESFDKIKHSRTANKSDASLEKVLNALGGLFIIEMKYLQKIVAGLDTEPDIPNELSVLFELKDWAYNYIPAKQVYFPTKDGDIILGGQVIAE